MAGRDLNKVMATGNLGADPEMRYTPTGSAVTTFRIASGRSWTTPDGQKHQETEWMSIVAWDKLAEVCNQYLTKGSRVYVEGRLATRSWDDKQTGEKRYRTEIIANDMIILSSRGEQALADEDREPPSVPEPEPAQERLPRPVKGSPPPAGATPVPPAPPARPGVRPPTFGQVPNLSQRRPSNAPDDAQARRPAPRNLPQASDDDSDLPF